MSTNSLITIPQSIALTNTPRGHPLPMARETGVPSQVESSHRLKQLYLISPCLTRNIIRYVSRVKWINPRKGVAPLPTPQCCSYWKGNLHIDLNYSQQFYLYMYIDTSLWTYNHTWYLYLSIYLSIKMYIYIDTYIENIYSYVIYTSIYLSVKMYIYIIIIIMSHHQHGSP